MRERRPNLGIWGPTLACTYLHWWSHSRTDRQEYRSHLPGGPLNKTENRKQHRGEDEAREACRQTAGESNNHPRP